jgi:hypothetical protein
VTQCEHGGDSYLLQSVCRTWSEGQLQMHLLVNVEFDQSTKLMFCLNLELQMAFAAKQFMHGFFVIL